MVEYVKSMMKNFPENDLH